MRHVLCRVSTQTFRRLSIARRSPGALFGSRWSSTGASHQWSTPLAKQLAEAITITGPVPVASYMRQCLTSDLGGYYTSSPGHDRDQFGAKGDFVTSPEISQIFGELIGIWIVAEWIAQGRKTEGIYLMEVGPGRGTLMDDILRTIRNFPQMARAIEAVYLVEASKTLQQAQQKLLCGDNPLQETAIGLESKSRHSPDLKVIWAEDVRFIPREADHMPFIIAHEFFDALPIHVFQSSKQLPEQVTAIQTPTGPTKSAKSSVLGNIWRELLVSPKPPHRLKSGEPEFELTVSKSRTPHSMYLPETSSRYSAVRSIDGATIEISPESQAYVRDFAIRLGGTNPQPAGQARVVRGDRSATDSEEALRKPVASGAALIIDYGQPSSIPANSLRGIRAHTRVSPFASAGAVDISADVDFIALAESAIQSSPGVEVHGPVDQARFLTAMGIEERAAQLVKRAIGRARDGRIGNDKSDLTDIVKRVESGWKRLVDRSPQGMGRLYQVMAILPHHPLQPGQQKRRPVGFGGDINL